MRSFLSYFGASMEGINDKHIDDQMNYVKHLVATVNQQVFNSHISAYPTNSAAGPQNEFVF